MLLTVHIDDALMSRLDDAVASEKANPKDRPRANRRLTEAEFARIFQESGGDQKKFEAARREILGLPELRRGRPLGQVSRRSVIEAALAMYLDKRHPSKKQEG